jgi:uncharacterized membrane protein
MARKKRKRSIDVLKENLSKSTKTDKIKGDIQQILKGVRELNKDLDDTGLDVDDIKEDVEDIKKDIGEDVDEIREDIQEIKEDLDLLHAKKGFFDKLKAIPEKFGADDLAQQIVGAVIVSSPFAVTEEVWKLSDKLTTFHLAAIILINITFALLLFKFAKFKSIDMKNIGILPLRVISLIFVAYSVTTIMLFVFGVLGGQVTQLLWGFKLVILVGLFASIGAGTADLIK